MRHRIFTLITAVSASIIVMAPVSAHEAAPPMPPEGRIPEAMAAPGWAQQREAWLTECRRRISDDGLGGAVIGGIVGGVAGNAIAGRGNRAVGTVAGAVVGAVAGAAIDKAEDRARVRDRCTAMLDGYGAQGYDGQSSYGYGYPGYGYAVPMMMVPVMMVPAPVQKPQCKEVVTTEYVTVYEPVRRRMIAPRPRPAPKFKRVRLSPDKRQPAS